MDLHFEDNCGVLGILRNVLRVTVSHKFLRNIVKTITIRRTE